ncbi:hypothetical protein [Pseudomonas sp. SO81]|uniref:hypothetical protein n=1 Tax=Pseudomonas sp. SO81 TaxID=2983246 RepID=UPI0025A49EAC|nr:hypothetical protein [Pseudomonas sp. SO81]WJN61305.1 hypothetical protein OH686_21380 [Pseudomonas sp. SO81]
MSGMTPSSSASLIAAQAAGVTLTQAIALLKLANRYVGTNNSTRAMDLSVEITEFVASYQRSQDSLAGKLSDNSLQTNQLEAAL